MHVLQGNHKECMYYKEITRNACITRKPQGMHVLQGNAQ